MNAPIPAPRVGAETKKPIPAPRTKIMLARRKSNESSSSKSSEEIPKKPLSSRVKSLSKSSKQIAEDFSEMVQSKILESTRQSMRRLTRSFSMSNHQVEKFEEPKTVEENDGNIHIFNSIKFDSPMNPDNPKPYQNWEPRKNANEVLSELFNLPPPSYPPPSLPPSISDESYYDLPSTLTSPCSTLSKKPTDPPTELRKPNVEAYESVFPLKSKMNDEITKSIARNVEVSSVISCSDSWKYYDTCGRENKEFDKSVLTPIRASDCPIAEDDSDVNSNFSVEVRNSLYENFRVPPTPPRPSQSVIFQFDPLMNKSGSQKDGTTDSDEYRAMEEILYEDLYGKISSARTVDTWSLSDSDVDEFLNPPSPPVRVDSLNNETPQAEKKTEDPPKSTVTVSTPSIPKQSSGERKGWLKQMKDAVLATSSQIMSGKPSKELTPRPTIDSKNYHYKKGMLYKVQNGPVEDLFGEYSGRWCILECNSLICYSSNTCENIKEHFPIDSILSIEVMHNPKLRHKLDNYDLYCFKLNVSGKIRGGHVYGSRNNSERRVWMQMLVESLTNKFCSKFTSDYTKMGWGYVREAVTGKWFGAWVILSQRTLQYVIDHHSVKTIDLRKARCITFQLYEDCVSENPQTNDKGPNMLVDTGNKSLYLRMWTSRETKIWCRLIKTAAHSNGANLDEQQLTKNDVPVIVEKCINFIYLHGSMSKGIYRQSGVGSVVSDLLTKFSEDAWAVQLTKDKFSEHDVATALKRFFRNLPEPLLGTTQHKYFYQVATIKNIEEQTRMYKAALENLSPIAFKTVKKLFGHLHFISTQSSKNLMNVVNLSAIWGPTLLHTKMDNESRPTKAHQQDTIVVGQLISLYKNIFPEDSIESEQEKIMLAILEKHAMAPHGAVAQNSGDFRLWIYLHNREGQMFNVVLGPNKTAAELCQELGNKAGMQVYEMVLEESVLDGNLTRPIHHSEKVLDIILKWSNWDELDRKNNCIIINNLSKYVDYLEAKILLASSELKCADSKSKNFKSLNFEFAHGKLTAFKDKSGQTQLFSHSIEDIVWYIGHEAKRNPPLKWTMTFLLKTEVPKRTKSSPFFGNVIMWNDNQSRANWLAIMLKMVHPDGLTQQTHVNIT